MPKHLHFRFNGKISKKESGDFYTSGASAHMPDVNATSLLHLHNLSLPCHTMLKTSNSNFSWFSTLYWVGRKKSNAFWERYQCLTRDIVQYIGKMLGLFTHSIIAKQRCYLSFWGGSYSDWNHDKWTCWRYNVMIEVVKPLLYIWMWSVNHCRCLIKLLPFLHNFQN